MVHARSEGLKERIAAVAASLFYAEGINRVGVDRVAEKAGVTKKTLYRHFPSKDQLIVEALRISPIVLFPHDGPPFERIRGAFEALHAYLRDSGFRGCPYNIYSAELTDRSHAARKLIERRIGKRHAWFEARLQEAGLIDATSLAEELDVLFDGALAAGMKSGTLAPVHAATRVALRLLETARIASPIPIAV